MKQAMIFAAGLGTRLKPLTDTMPKALVRVGGQPLIDIVISRLLAAEYDHFVVNIHHFAQQIKDYVSIRDYAPMVQFSDETAQLLETGGGLKKAAPLFDAEKPILIHNVDILDNVDYDWFSRQHLPEEDAVLLVSKRKTKRYLLFDNAMRLMGWNTGLSQHGEPFNEFAFSGIHSFSPRLFSLMEQFPERFPIIDFYLSVCHRARIVGMVKDDLQLMDVGKLDTLDQAEQFIKSL